VHDDTVSTDYVNLQTQLDYLYPTTNREGHAQTCSDTFGHVQFQVQRRSSTSDAKGRLCGVAQALATSMGSEPAEQTLIDKAKMKECLRKCLKQRFFSLFSRRRSSHRCLLTNPPVSFFIHSFLFISLDLNSLGLRYTARPYRQKSIKIQN